jgi:hypothetical protein
MGPGQCAIAVQLRCLSPPRRVDPQFLNGDVWPYGNYFHNVTGLNDYDK